VLNRITPADISDPQEVIARAKALSIELATRLRRGSRRWCSRPRAAIEDIYELTYIRKDGSRFPAIVSVTALRDDRGVIIGYLLIGPITPRASWWKRNCDGRGRLQADGGKAVTVRHRMLDPEGHVAELGMRSATDQGLRHRGGSSASIFFTVLSREDHRPRHAAARPRRGESQGTVRAPRLGAFARTDRHFGKPGIHCDPGPGRQSARFRQADPGPDRAQAGRGGI